LGLGSSVMGSHAVGQRAARPCIIKPSRAQLEAEMGAVGAGEKRKLELHGIMPVQPSVRMVVLTADRPSPVPVGHGPRAVGPCRQYVWPARMAMQQWQWRQWPQVQTGAVMKGPASHGAPLRVVASCAAAHLLALCDPLPASMPGIAALLPSLSAASDERACNGLASHLQQERLDRRPVKVCSSCA